MRERYLLDTGPLVALLNKHDKNKKWSADLWAHVSPPFLTCEAVLAEAAFLLRDCPGASATLMDFCHRGAIQIPFRLEEHAESLAKLMRKYSSTPMSLADACLVRMSEITPSTTIATFDSDFLIYRKYGRQRINLVMPDHL